MFLGVWEQLNNVGFKPLEFEGFRNEAGSTVFVLSATTMDRRLPMPLGWFASAGRYGGTYAHKGHRFRVRLLVSAEFKLYLIKEFQRLKDEENDRLPSRGISTAPWPRSTTASTPTPSRETLIPPAMTNRPRRHWSMPPKADLLNVALFGQIAKQWRDAQPQGRRQRARSRARSSNCWCWTNLERPECRSHPPWACPRASASNA